MNRTTPTVFAVANVADFPSLTDAQRLAEVDAADEQRRNGFLLRFSDESHNLLQAGYDGDEWQTQIEWEILIRNGGFSLLRIDYFYSH